MKPIPSHLGGLQKSQTFILFIYLIYFQLDKLLTFSGRVLIFLPCLLNSGNTSLLIPVELPCTASLKCGLELQKPKWGPPFSAKTRKFLMVSYILLLDTNTLLHPPKTMQMARVNCMGLAANIPHTSEDVWLLWVPNFAWKGHGQMCTINLLVLKLVCYPLSTTRIPSTQTVWLVLMLIFPKVVINRITYYSQKCPGLEDKLYNHPACMLSCLVVTNCWQPLGL